MWRAAGDTATDFNFYTKRALLAGVYGATLLVWLDDRSEGCAATWRFLDRRIADVMTIQTVRGRLAARLPRGDRVVAALCRIRAAR
jgi:ubiquinone biosynthesis protein COQ9